MADNAQEERDLKAKAMGATHVIAIGEGEERKVVYLKKLNRQIVGAAMAKAGTDPLQSSDMLLRSHIIPEYSDMDVLTDDAYYFSAIAQVQQLIEFKAGELKRL